MTSSNGGQITDSESDSGGSPLKDLLIAVSALLLVYAFLRLASEVGEGETGHFDHAILLAAQSARASHAWVAEVMRDLSGLGSAVALSLVTVSTVAYLALLRKLRTALLLACAVLSGTLLVSLFKANFGRPRPEARYAELAIAGWSFPSGHASMSAVVFLTLGALIASARTNRFERRFILLIAAMLTFLVGMSRVVLGVHYATDVLGGWIFGTSWAIAWLLFAKWFAIHFQPSTQLRP
nr:phosphatase PAP2 family protein [Rhodoferax sp.]